MNLSPFRSVAVAALAVGVVIPVAAQTSTPAEASTPGSVTVADPYRDESFVFEKLDSTIRMKADGTGDTLTHVILRVQSEGVAREFSVLSVSYASANETGSIDFVRVHKPDGTIVETPTADAMEMPAEVTREAPVYSDIREKHLPVRSLSSGDRLEYQFHTVRTRAEAPNQFWGAQHLAVNAGVVLSQTVTLEAPATTYLQVWSPNHPATPVTKDGMKVWTWTSSQTKPSQRDENGKMTAADVKDPDEDADGRKLPSMAWTTFHTWAEVGDWYRSLALPRAEPTEAIRAKAADLTKDAKTPEEQVQALYRYVALQTRYIGISLGVGRYQPHAAADVMANQYGDCKDKDTLLEALLKAKGFTTAPALIGAGIVPVPELPSPAVFNHVITTVQMPGTPDRIWLDATAEVAPFRVLMPVIRDQKALVVPQQGDASLEVTPADPPFPYVERFQSVGTLSDTGVLKSHVEVSYRSDQEMGLRAALRQVAPAQWDQLMQAAASGMNFGGKVSNADLRQTDPSAPVRMSFDYTREDYGDWKNNRIWATLPSVEITFPDKDKAPEHDIDLGAPRTLQAESIITVPAGDRVEIPEPRHVTRPYASYDETYRFSDGKWIANRVMVIRQHKLVKTQWKDYVDFLTAAGMYASMAEATLIPPAGKSSSTAAASKADDKKAEPTTAAELQNAALESERKGDWKAAREYAEKGVRNFPDAPYSRSVLAYVDAHDKRYDEAIVGYKAELASHPDAKSSIVQLLAGAYANQKRYDDAIATLQQYSSRNDESLLQMQSSLQVRKGDLDGALLTARHALELKPEDKSTQTQIARLLQRLHRDDEAAAAAEKALEGSDDPNLINNNAYFLAEMKRNMPLAESSSRRSVGMYERMTSTGVVDEANTRSFNLTYQMIAAWDTLADILLIQGKAKAAVSYLEPAWFQVPDPTKGNHLAQAYEEAGRAADARRIDAMVLSMKSEADYKEEWAAVKDREKRLAKTAPEGHDGGAALTAMRTYKLKRPQGVEGSGIVRSQMNATGVLDASVVSGDTAALKPLVAQIKELRMPAAVPPASQARVLRDAVLFCGKTAPTCDLVFMERSGIAQEGLDK